ncbi:glycosyltransferase family 2 protein [uncultured Leifsonia sp.]|uniref:glycosyltransferase family 2 protein n=1 Tax=uncultured Leifsonia sp. TaxID=340359 RepID=UPI0025F74058|nr:glycosyltransferase family 2 protein [uncultured Leifsonia sp.]
MTLDIMMPFYGRFDHFKAAVESVLAQDDDDWRLVIVDDVYPDTAPGEWAKSLGDPRVEYIRNEENLRPSRNYRKCVSLTRTEHVVIMGCDDLMRPGYVRRVKEILAENPGADIVQPGVEVVDEAGRVHHPIGDRVKSWLRPSGRGARAYSGERLARSLLGGNWTYFPSLVWKTEDLRKHKFRLDLDVVQDLAMLLDITLDGGRLIVDDEVVFAYRRHATSVSAVTGPDGSKFAQERELFMEFERRCRALGWGRAAGAAQRHWSSRLSAATELPAALRSRNAAGRRSLLRHVFGR